MKLKRLNIESYRHLEGIEFDFTYPEDHEKAGQPLEKICIIGQSATGKTSILELLKDTFQKLKITEIVNGTHIFSGYRLEFDGILQFVYNNELLSLEKNEITYKGHQYKEIGSGGGAVGEFFQEGLKLLYISAEIITKQSINLLNQNPIDLITILSDEKYKIFIPEHNLNNYVCEFTQDIDEGLWFSLLKQILDYRKRFTQMASELINKGTIGDLTKLNKEYDRWSSENENPLIDFAHYFNPILNKLNLQIDLVNTEYTIPVKSKIKDEVIPISGLSTGTKGLLLSMFPLFELDTDDAIILIDEPERSLFPDMQIELMQHYQRMAPKAQFVVATHSPFIAAAFEPAERFILYFDDKGKVAVRRGESPIGDDPNDMLRNDFNVDYYNEFGKKAYQDYLGLKSKIAQTDVKEEKEKLIVELAELGDKYNF